MENDVVREKLMQEFEECNKLFLSRKKELDAHLNEVIKSYLRVKNIPSVHDVRIRFSHGIEILIGTENENNRIELDFDKDYYDDNNRILKLNYCCFGQFGSKNKPCRDYIIALGRIVEEMDSLEKSILDFDWSSFDELDHNRMVAKYKLESHDNSVKEKKYKDLCAEIESKLKAGVEVIIGKKSAWNESTKQFEQIDNVKEIEKITNKTLVFTGAYGRFKKDDVVTKIANGVWQMKGFQNTSQNN